MGDSIPDPYLSQTGFDDDVFDAEDSDLAFDDADSELDIEEDRAREH